MIFGQGKLKFKERPVGRDFNGLLNDHGTSITGEPANGKGRTNSKGTENI
jgi:hypothetical protein